MTENGWPPDTDAHPFVSIPLSQCVQVTIPGTQETLWFQKGAPAVLLPAFAAAMNDFIEPLLNSQGYNDEGTWTNGNSVGTSNHLGATAMDYNWDDHPFEIDVNDPAAGWKGSTLIDGDEVPAVRELLDYCEGTIFWGADWPSPKDSMHFQIGYNTYDPSTGDAQQWVKDFIARKIGIDGKLLWRPSWLAPATGTGSTTGTDTGSTSTTGSDTSPAAAVTALYDAVPVIEMDRAAQLVTPIMAGLAAAECTNDKRIAEFLAQTGHEADGYNTTEEYADGSAYDITNNYDLAMQLGNTTPGDGVKYKGRTWIQITGKAHYAAFGQWCVSQGLISDPDQFVNDPASLADIKWAGIGAAWYWTVERPQINSLCDAGDIVGVTEAINGGTNGLDDRTARYNQAIALGDELLALIETPTTPTSGGTITLADISQDDWKSLVADVKEIRAQLNGDGTFAQTGSDPAALQRLEDLAASGKPMSMLDAVAWVKHHASTHKAPTP